MSLPLPEISVVLPVRNAEQRIVSEIERILEALADLTDRPAEVLVVDDASEDSTPELISELRARYPQVRSRRMSQVQGPQSACDVGLDQARGLIVFLQEDHGPLRVEDLRRLYRMSEDQTVVAARAHSTPRPPSGPLLARMQQAGAERLRKPVVRETTAEPSTTSTLQMIRRDRLRPISANAGPDQPVMKTVFESEWFDLSSVIS